MSANQRKDRLFAQFASNLQLLKQHSAQTTDLVEGLQGDLDAMRTFAGIHAAQFMTVAAGLNSNTDQSEASPRK
ncbi:hypothetical protein M0805_006706 [Coniferiporia weirii]|nr:hypothetical protein M0805_006706 [Coniferiporia weirii]